MQRGPRSLAPYLVERGGLVGLCALIAYVAIASQHLVAADNAEFATLGALGGVAHPSGYPAYVLWLRAWSWLPGASAAHTAALATALLGAVTIVALHAACRAWGARPIAANVAVAIIAAAPIVLELHSEAEVFAMNNLVAALVLWLAATNGPLRGPWRGAALGLVAGLGIADHLTCTLLAPIGLYGVVRAARESRATTYAISLLGLAIGLLPYGYLFVADGPASWGTVSTPEALLATILRREYGGLSLVPGGPDVPWTTSIGACLATIARSWLWGFAVAGVVMLGVRIRRPVGETRWAWALLAASFVLAGPALASQFNIDPHGIGLYICRRFHVLPSILLAIPVAAALDVVCARITRPVVAAALTVVGFVALLFVALPRVLRVHSPAMELGVRNLLRSLPPSAIVVVVSEDQCFGGRYLQLVQGERPDVAFVCSELLRRHWYRASWAARGLAMPFDPGVGLRDVLLRTGRPVFVDRALPGVIAGAPSYPFGVVSRVLPPTAQPPSPAEVAAINRDLFQAFDLDYARPYKNDDFAAVAHRRYAGCWAAVAGLLDAAGDREGAQDAVAVARSLQPIQEAGPGW